MKALLSAAQTMLPAPLPTNEEARLRQLNNEAFVSSFILSNMIEAVRNARNDELLFRLYRIHSRMGKRHARRNARLIASLPTPAHPILLAADASAPAYESKL